MLVATMFLREAVAHPAFNYVTTRPGEAGLVVAFVAEFGISFMLMSWCSDFQHYTVGTLYPTVRSGSGGH